VEYLSDPAGRANIHGNSILVPSGYELSGQAIGGFWLLKSKENVARLIVEALVWKSKRTLGLLWTLAEQGNGKCLLRLAQIVVPFVKAINEEAGKNVQALGGWPKSLPVWPVLKSPHHDLDCDHQRFLRLLQVGEAFPLTIADEARWTARDPVGKWAIHLCQEIEIMQDGHPVDEESEPWEHKLEQLQPFSGATWKDWWEVARGLLLHDYVDVVEIPDPASLNV
jgi:hypothetical protein